MQSSLIYAIIRFSCTDSMFYSLLTAAVKALKNAWCIGDDFLCENYHALQDLKTDAKMKKVDIPYFFMITITFPHGT